MGDAELPLSTPAGARQLTDLGQRSWRGGGKIKDTLLPLPLPLPLALEAGDAGGKLQVLNYTLVFDHASTGSTRAMYWEGSVCQA